MMLAFSEKKQENNQSVINLIYENNTTGIKHPIVQPSILAPGPRGAVAVFDMLDFKLSCFITEMSC